MKHRGRSPASSSVAKPRDTLRSGGTGSSSGRSIASDHEHEEASGGNIVSSHPAGMLAAATSTLVAATAEESLTLPTLQSSSTGFSPSHHPHHTRHHSSTFPMNFSAQTADSDTSSLGNSIFYDDPDILAQLSQSGTPDPALTQKAIEHYQSKIGKTKEQIKEVQTSLDENVNEYLKLSANATDGNQQQRIKQVFEKKNQKSAQQIAQLQKKLEEYNRKVRDLEKYGLQKPKIRDFGQGLKHVGGNIRDGISGMSSTVMSKPKEFANFVMRHNKYGSADNLSSVPSSKDSKSIKDSTGESSSTVTATGEKKPNSSSLPRDGSAGGTGSMILSNKCLSEDGGVRRRSTRASEASDTTSNSMPPGAAGKSQSSQSQAANQGGVSGVPSPKRMPGLHLTTEEAAMEWNAIIQELTLHKEEVDRVREEMDELRQNFEAKLDALNYKLSEERETYARLEDQINDMTELHQHEIENIKSGITDMEEKVQYQSEERLLDIKEHLQSLETKVNSMEHQQAQNLNIEGLDSSDARAIMMKLLNALITFVHVILFFIGTFMNLTKPFLRTTPRILTTTMIVIISLCAYHQQEAVLALILKLKTSAANKAAASSGTYSGKS